MPASSITTGHYLYCPYHLIAPIIIQGPQSQTAVVQDTIVLTCIANYTDTIEWFKDGDSLPSSAAIEVVEESDDVLRSILSFNATLEDGNSNYSCNASSMLDYVVSDNATITILCKYMYSDS